MFSYITKHLKLIVDIDKSGMTTMISCKIRLYHPLFGHKMGARRVTVKNSESTAIVYHTKD